MYNQKYGTLKKMWTTITEFLLSVPFLRAHAGDSVRLLEDGVAGEYSRYRHGDQPGGSGQGGY